MSCHFKIRAVKELQNLIEVTRDRFPNADIFVPFINFSRVLQIVQQQMIEDINVHIQKNCDFIPSIPNIYFTVEKDGIHWRSATTVDSLVLDQIIFSPIAGVDNSESVYNIYPNIWSAFVIPKRSPAFRLCTRRYEP